MRIYLRTLRYIRPYLGQLILSTLFMIVFSVLSGMSVLMISPFLGTLFSTEAPLDAGAGEATGEAAGEAAGQLAAPPPVSGAPAALDLGAGVTGLTGLRDRLKARVDGYLLRGTKLEALWRICVIFFFIYLVKNAAGYLQAVLMSYVGLRMIKDLRDELFTKFMHLPLAFYHQRRAGELISRATNDVQVAYKCVNVSFTNLVRDPIFIVVFLAQALLISWQLTLLALAVLPLSMLIIIRIGQKLRKYSHRQQEKMANLTSILQETVTGVRVVKAFVMERFEGARFLAESHRLFRDMYKMARIERLSSPLTEQLSVGVGLFILWYGGRQVLAGAQQLPPDLFIVFLVCIFSLVHPVKALSGVNNNIQEGMAAAERIFAVLDVVPEPVAAPGARELARPRGEVAFEDVWFAYVPGEPVLRGISLRVAPGEVVALVGPSGAGKSTLVDLIPRFYEPQQGRVLIDGQDVRGFTLPSLRRAMGIVTQEVILFNDTVRANIAYGLRDVDQARIEAAARAANAHDFIAQMPRGYDTVIGDRGVKMSGGQRQRLSIARAILKDPPILILDEATSALDTESELLVQEAIDRLVRDRTTIVIAHRLSTIQSADRIHVLKDGRLVQTGTHAELVEAEGPYRALHNLQFRS